MKFNKFLALMLLFMPHIASAQDYNAWGMNRVDGVALGTRSLGQTISGVINIVLGFLGIIVTVGILAGGYMYMTSGGNADQADKGKDVLGASLIGLAIVVSAYAIARFVLGKMFEETTGNDIGVEF